MRVFLAHPKSFEVDHETKVALAQQLRLAMPEQPPDEPIYMRTGKEDFERNFASSGGWDAWARNIVEGVNFEGADRVPLYDIIVVLPSDEIGKATAQIVRHALAVRKPVLFFDGKLLRCIVTRVTQIRASFTDGWLVQ